jgi:DNA protecting protein DprA
LESSEQAIAVVGARCSSGYGEHVTGEIVGDLAAQGWTIVSGAAFGIDGMAHRCALAIGAPTIAVLACGVDRPYPAQHERLLDEIAETGLVISEYPPGTVAHKNQFLARNRLIAGRRPRRRSRTTQRRSKYRQMGPPPRPSRPRHPRSGHRRVIGRLPPHDPRR